MRINSYVPSQEIFNTGSNTDNTSEVNGIEEFSNTLQQALSNINDQQVTADNITNDFISGGDSEISDVMLAAEEAKVSLQLAVQVRNKLLDAFNELSDMQL